MGKFKVGDEVWYQELNSDSPPERGAIATVTDGGEPYALRYSDGMIGSPIWYDNALTLVGSEEPTASDAINPKHYSEGMPAGVQVIDIIRAQDADFLHGNVIKYLLRWKYKNGVTDLKKAQQYLTWLVEQEEAKND